MLDTLTRPRAEQARLPARRIDAAGQAQVDYRAVLALAAPLFLNSGVQAILNLTDTWFAGRISSAAVAAIGAVHFLIIASILLLGGVGLAVQSLVAQSYGARRYAQGAYWTWAGLWSALLTVPVFAVLAMCGEGMLSPFHLDPEIEKLAVAYWIPRIAGASGGVALWAIMGFFNGVGKTRVTLEAMLIVALVNAVLNEIFIFHLHMGIAGSAWATSVSTLIGVVFCLVRFLAPQVRRAFRSHRVWRPRPRAFVHMLGLGLPMGLFGAVDLFSFALFQLMQVSLGTVDGAATQIVMMLTSVAYMPGIGLALAGTTLVGQSIGAGNPRWAMRVGNTIITLAAGFMAVVGFSLAVGGPWLIPWFTQKSDPLGAAVIARACTLIWIGAGYQVFDALNIASAFCLRGANDVRVPALLLIALSAIGFVPLAHSLSFAPDQGWVQGLPQFGWGAVGGWLAALVYIMALGLTLFGRWRSGIWQRVRRGTSLRP
jgi:MATE family multidrug resistance protein